MEQWVAELVVSIFVISVIVGFLVIWNARDIARIDRQLESIKPKTKPTDLGGCV